MRYKREQKRRKQSSPLILRSLRYFFGYVEFTGIGGYLSPFLADCAAQGLNIWNFRRDEETHTFSGWILANRYRLLRKPARKHGVRIRLKERVGIPFWMNRYHKRIGIVAGAAIFLIVLTFLSNFVWGFTFVGNESVSEEELQAALEEFGLKTGSYIPSLDIRELEQRMLLKVKELSWIGININSSVAEIRVHEVVEPPEFHLKEDRPYDVVASQDGQIQSIEVYVGQPLVKRGDVVRKGNLLVSGIVEDPKGNVSLKHARAKIMAKVWETKEFCIPLKQEKRVDTGQEKTRYTLQAFGLKLPLFFGEPRFDYYTEETQIPLTIFGFSLPISVKQERLIGYEMQTITLNQQQAKREAFEQYRSFLKETFGDVPIENELLEESLEDGEYVLSARFWVVKDIAQEEEILIELPEEKQNEAGE